MASEMGVWEWTSTFMLVSFESQKRAKDCRASRDFSGNDDFDFAFILRFEGVRDNRRIGRGFPKGCGTVIWGERGIESSSDSESRWGRIDAYSAFYLSLMLGGFWNGRFV